MNKNTREKIVRKAAATVKARKGDKPVKAKVEVAPVAATFEVVAPVAKVKEKKVLVTVEGVMAKLPAMPRAAKSRKAKPEVDCACGCGSTTKGTWAPGHDARAKAWAIRVERDIITIDQVPANERKGAERVIAERKANPPAGPKMKLVAKVKTTAEPVAVNE